jgi:hypothetical protein
LGSKRNQRRESRLFPPLLRQSAEQLRLIPSRLREGLTFAFTSWIGGRGKCLVEERIIPSVPSYQPPDRSQQLPLDNVTPLTLSFHHHDPSSSDDVRQRTSRTRFLASLDGPGSALADALSPVLACFLPVTARPYLPSRTLYHPHVPSCLPVLPDRFFQPRFFAPRHR